MNGKRDIIKNLSAVKSFAYILNFKYCPVFHGLIVIQFLLDPFHHKCDNIIKYKIEHARHHKRTHGCFLGRYLLGFRKHLGLRENESKRCVLDKRYGLIGNARRYYLYDLRKDYPRQFFRTGT